VSRALKHFPITFIRQNPHLRLSSEADLLDQIIVVKRDEPIPAQIYDTRRDYPIPEDGKFVIGYSNREITLNNSELSVFPDEECLLKKRSKSSPHGLRKTLFENVANSDKSARSIVRSEGIDYDFHDTGECKRNRTAGNHPLQRSLSSLERSNRGENAMTADSENSRSSSVHSKRSKPRRCNNDDRSLDSKRPRTPLQVHGQSIKSTSMSLKSYCQSRDDDSMVSLRSSRSRSVPRQQEMDTRSVQSKASVASKHSLTSRTADGDKTCYASPDLDVASAKSYRSGTTRAGPNQHDDDKGRMQSIYRQHMPDEKSVASGRSQTSRSVKAAGDEKSLASGRSQKSRSIKAAVDEKSVASGRSQTSRSMKNAGDDSARVQSKNQRQKQVDGKSDVSRSSTTSQSSLRSKNRRKSRGRSLSRSTQHKSSGDMSRLEELLSSRGGSKKPKKEREEKKRDPPSKNVISDGYSSPRAIEELCSPTEHVSNCRGKKSRGAKDPPGVKKGCDSDQESSEHYDNFPFLSMSSSFVMKSNDVHLTPQTTNSPWQPYT
jgi:hypothetical protein